MNMLNRSLPFPCNNLALNLGVTILTGTTVFTLVNPANAVILSTNFNGRTVSGATASNLNWTTNGVSNPGNLTANFNLFNTTATQNLFAVNRNLHTAGSWSVDITVGVGSRSIDLGEISLDAYIFNNSGATQAFSRDFDLTINLLDSTKTNILATQSVVNLFPNSNTIPNPSPVPFVFDFTGNTLQANETFFLRLIASGQGSTPIVGNNGGIDNLVVNGNFVSVPEPSSGLETFGGLGLLLAFKRKLSKK